MKKFFALILSLLLIFACLGCTSAKVDIAATTLPVSEFTARICAGTDITVGRVVTESVSCLHDYTLQVDQMRMLESANIVVISGAGLEEFLEDALHGCNHVIDASLGTHVHNGEDHAHEYAHEEDGHQHESDPHIWLSPENAIIMASNIAAELSAAYPQHSSLFFENLNALVDDLTKLEEYGQETLSTLSCRELVTFHDGFGYFAEAFDLTILKAVEEESGSEASAAELKELIHIVRNHSLPAVFTEYNGSVSAADIIAAETGAKIYSLDMAMSGNSYIDAMYHNIETIKEAME